VEHPCHKCGAAVEDGTPFCKQCGAPQIRVPGIEAVESSAPGPAAITPIESAPEVPSIPSVLLSEGRSPGVQWAHALPGAALGGAFSLLAAIVPYAIFGPAFLAGGAVAVILYRRHIKDRLPSAGAGAGGLLKATTEGFAVWGGADGSDCGCCLVHIVFSLSG